LLAVIAVLAVPALPLILIAYVAFGSTTVPVKVALDKRA